MMGELFNEKRVRTRKPHRCAYCGDEIPAGTEGVLYEWGFYDGASFSRHTCDACEPTVSRFWDWCGETTDLEESWRYFMEMVADEPYKVRITKDRSGRLAYASCGNCWHSFLPDSSRIPKYCPNCQCETKV